MQSSSTSRILSSTVIWLLFLGVVILAIVPLLLHPESEFGGADGSAEAVITAINPDVEPWFAPFWEPPGGETESLLFALQAALGAGFIGYYFGFKRGEARRKQHLSEHDHE
ncbi:MAG: energy-coupling factor ABC transporter substrate-binding protein [Chloroflexaceae bacterium]|nr:energy-coupling factor ABC transporter substrate-binding protein [Chloroflexaceae bacterium]